MKGQERKTKKGGWFSLLLPLLFVLTAVSEAIGAEYQQIVLGGFSPDGTRLLLNYCRKEGDCGTGYLDFRRQEFVRIEPPDKDQVWTVGAYSNDGRKIALSVKRKSDNGRSSQIGIIDQDANSVIEVTRGEAFRTAPSFSHDGKKIIYARANRERQFGKTRFSDWDVYEVGITADSERRLTNYRFFSLSSPAYMPDDARFIFSAEAPKEYVDELGQKGYRRYMERYRYNGIFIIDGREKVLAPVFAKERYSGVPGISRDGTRIVYAAAVEKEDGIKTRYSEDLFLLEQGVHRRVTRLQQLIADTSLSRDGKNAAFVTDVESKGGGREKQLWVVEIETGRLSRVDPASGQTAAAN